MNLPLTNNSFTLQNNNGDNFTVTQNGPFDFATPVALNGAYNVTVFTGPTTQNQACWYFNYKGIVTGNISSVVIDCGHNDWEWINGTKTAGTISAPQYGSFPCRPVDSSESLHEYSGRKSWWRRLDGQQWQSMALRRTR